jgi:hypothetical protein
MAAAFLQQRSVLRHVALPQCGEACAQRSGQAHAADDQAEGQPEVTLDSHISELKGRGDAERPGRREGVGMEGDGFLKFPQCVMS